MKKREKRICRHVKERSKKEKSSLSNEWASRRHLRWSSEQQVFAADCSISFRYLAERTSFFPSEIAVAIPTSSCFHDLVQTSAHRVAVMAGRLCSWSFKEKKKTKRKAKNVLTFFEFLVGWPAIGALGSERPRQEHGKLYAHPALMNGFPFLKRSSRLGSITAALRMRNLADNFVFVVVRLGRERDDKQKWCVVPSGAQRLITEEKCK